MKTFAFILILAGTITSLHAQPLDQADVPAKVQAVFAKKFPQAKSPRWRIQDDCFEAEFNHLGMESEILFDRNGKVLKSESEILLEDLPKTAKNYLTSEHPNQKPRELRLTTDFRGRKFYSAEIQDKLYQFNSKGILLGSEKLTESVREADQKDDSEDNP